VYTVKAILQEKCPGMDVFERVEYNVELFIGPRGITARRERFILQNPLAWKAFQLC
jgi:hypothetical protein